jgi:hypothetical protein
VLGIARARIDAMSTGGSSSSQVEPVSTKNGSLRLAASSRQKLYEQLLSAQRRRSSEGACGVPGCDHWIDSVSRRRIR